MRFRTIFALLNAVLFAAFGFILLVPALVLGREYAEVLGSGGAWAILLPVALFGAALLALNGYFLRRWRLFRLLDERDWRGVADNLRTRVLGSGHPGGLSVRLLANTLLLSGQVAEIAAVERHVRQRRPRLPRRLLLHLVIPYLIGDQEAGVRFFAREAMVKGYQPVVRAWLL